MNREYRTLNGSVRAEDAAPRTGGIAINRDMTWTKFHSKWRVWPRDKMSQQVGGLAESVSA